MKICVLASGSKGNCVYIESNKNKILIDIGISFKQLNLKLKQINVDVNEIDSVFITHDHNDHIMGLRTFSNNISCDFYLTEGTMNNLKNNVHETLSKKRFRIIKSFDEIFLNDINVNVFPTHHDAVESVGFKVVKGNKSMVYITDTGYIDQDNFHLIENANAYVFESNYDPAILYSSNRPFRVKKRILGDLGHMSNEDSAINLCYLMGESTSLVVHAHISLECNSEEVLVETFRRIFFEYKKDIKNIKFVCAKQYEPTEVFEI